MDSATGCQFPIVTGVADGSSTHRLRTLPAIRPRTTTMHIAINGFGRIGRLTFRRLQTMDDVSVVAINDLSAVDDLAYLLHYDTAQGGYPGEVSAAGDDLVVDGRTIPVFGERDAADLPWAALDVDVVIDCTGAYLTRERATAHLDAGADRVVLSAPPKSEDIPTVVLGVNDSGLTDDMQIVSNASCTTNCLAPMVKVLDEVAGVRTGFMTTVHSVTSSQAVQDGPSRKDKRRGRASSANIIPTTTGATKALGLVMPSMDGRIRGLATRVPVLTASLTDLVVQIERSVSVGDLNDAFRRAAAADLAGILGVTDDPVVSSDIIGTTTSCLIDAALTEVNDGLVKVVGWYDNEMGYASRLAELALRAGRL